MLIGLDRYLARRPPADYAFDRGFRGIAWLSAAFILALVAYNGRFWRSVCGIRDWCG